MKFSVCLTQEAEDDLVRLTETLIERCETADDFEQVGLTIQCVRAALDGLSDSAFRSRKAGDGRDPFLRELVIPYGKTGYLALFELVGDTVVVAAVRHQRESDYH